jgi:UDP-glucose 4-epimerase
MRILLTGSEGYIATNFKELYDDEFDIVYCDRKSSENNDPSFDVLDISSLNVDCIVHLAAISGIKQCEEDYEKTIKNNILTTSHLLSFNIPIVFASSQAAKNPTNTYALTKRISEMMIQRSGVPYSILRFANVYGGKKYFENKTSVVSQFVNAKLKNSPVTVHGDGKQTRDFIHVYDVCDAINLSILNSINDIVDIGTGIETSIRDLAYMISDDVEFLGINGGVSGNVADTQKAKELLGFESMIKIERYLREI